MNHFERFDLPTSVHVDLAVLKQRYYQQSMLYHPDRALSGQDVQTQEEATQQTSLINEAYRTLTAPMKRIGYIITLIGREDDMNASPDMAFLMEMMMLNEEVEALQSDAAEAPIVRSKIQEAIDAAHQKVAALPATDPQTWSPDEQDILLAGFRELKYLLRMRENLDSFAVAHD